MPDDLPLQRLRLLLARVREDAVADLVREVEAAGDRERVLVVAEAPPEALVAAPRRAPPRRHARTAGAPCRARARSPPRDPRSAQRPRDDARDGGRLERVRHPRAVVVALGVDEDLCLALQPAERLRVDDPVAVALERRADGRRLLGLARARASRTSGRRGATATPPRARGSAPRTRSCASALDRPWPLRRRDAGSSRRRTAPQRRAPAAPKPPAARARPPTPAPTNAPNWSAAVRTPGHTQPELRCEVEPACAPCKCPAAREKREDGEDDEARPVLSRSAPSAATTIAEPRARPMSNVRGWSSTQRRKRRFPGT